ncbi:MAG: hypothetical protein GY851_21525 [bacterium]|nr:hypothetical protein [bacterium]
MARPGSIGGILWFAARFAIAAPLCLVVWWLALPWYAAVLGDVTGWVLRTVAGAPVTDVSVVVAGILNTESQLRFVGEGFERSIPIGQVVSNVAPFLALMLATLGVTVRRRILLMVEGTVILLLCHAVYLNVAFLAARAIARWPQVPMAVGQLFITLPFLLWLVLTQWSPGGGKPSKKASEGPRNTGDGGSSTGSDTTTTSS